MIEPKMSKLQAIWLLHAEGYIETDIVKDLRKIELPDGDILQSDLEGLLDDWRPSIS